MAGAKAAAEKEAGLHKAIAALTRIEDAERQLRRRARAGEGEGEGGGFALRDAELISPTQIIDVVHTHILAHPTCSRTLNPSHDDGLGDDGVRDGWS